MSSSLAKQLICLWSGPRNVSTALMYAFAQRGDTTVVDEPLYGHYLKTSNAIHPGRDTVLQQMDTNGERVVRGLLSRAGAEDLLFCKMMAHHLLDLDWDFLGQSTNIILTRDPLEVLPTLSVQLGEPQLRDTGYDIQLRLLQASAQQGRPMPVLDAKELLLNPSAVLASLCDAIGIDYQPAMLNWPAGPKPYDGVWAPWWYQNVHRSTAFIPYKPKQESFPDRLLPLLEQCRPLYKSLYSAAIKAPLSKG